MHLGHGVAVTSVPTEVFVGGKALTPARWPNAGYAPQDGLVDAGSAPRNTEADIPVAERSHEAPRGGTFRVHDLQRLARWQRSPEPWAGGFWNWDWSDELLPIAKIDPVEGTVTLAMPHRYGIAARGRYYVTNILAELDAPGEFWIDVQHGRIHAWLPDGAAQQPVEVSMLQAPILTIEGGSQVRLRNLAFRTTRGNAVVLRLADDAEVRGCRFARIGVQAVEAEGHSVVIAQSEFEGIGGTGVILTSGERRTLTPSGSRIEDCTFRDCEIGRAHV